MKIHHPLNFNPRERQLVTLDELRDMVPNAGVYRLIAIHPFLLDTLHRYEINTPLRICHFLAQVIHESGSFHYMNEIASGDAYEGRADLGNTNPGDGKRFKGRGLIQLTGRANYEAYNQYLAVRSDKVWSDIMANPEKVAHDPEIAVDVAGWFWHKKDLNTYADIDDIKAVTKRINGGYNGLADRQKHLERAKSVLT